MATPRDKAVSEYVWMRVDEILAKKDGVENARQLAERVGVSASGISQRGGIAGGSIDLWAKYLKFKDADELRNTAYDWYMRRRHRSASEGRAAEPAVQQALDALRSTHPKVSEETWSAIIARFEHEDFAGRESGYWVTTLGNELAQDALRERQQKYARARAGYTRELEQLEKREREPKRSRADQMVILNALLAKTPQPIAMHFHKFEESSDEELAELIRSLKHLLGE